MGQPSSRPPSQPGSRAAEASRPQELATPAEIQAPYTPAEQPPGQPRPAQEAQERGEPAVSLRQETTEQVPQSQREVGSEQLLSRQEDEASSLLPRDSQDPNSAVLEGPVVAQAPSERSQRDSTSRSDTEQAPTYSDEHESAEEAAGNAVVPGERREPSRPPSGANTEFSDYIRRVRTRDSHSGRGNATTPPPAPRVPLRTPLSTARPGLAIPGGTDGDDEDYSVEDDEDDSDLLSDSRKSMEEDLLSSDEAEGAQGMRPMSGARPRSRSSQRSTATSVAGGDPLHAELTEEALAALQEQIRFQEMLAGVRPYDENVGRPRSRSFNAASIRQIGPEEVDELRGAQPHVFIRRTPSGRQRVESLADLDAALSSRPDLVRLGVGDHVRARYAGGDAFYPARVANVYMDGSIDVLYDDGDREVGVPPHYYELVSRGFWDPERVRAALAVGLQVEARYEGGRLWRTGVISQIGADRKVVTILYHTGHQERGVPVEWLRIVDMSPLRLGDRVVVQFGGGTTYYPGVIKSVHRGNLYTIAYDSGQIEARVARWFIRVA